jgi:hypothetical protein
MMVSIVKAAHAIDEALKPELKHPNPPAHAWHAELIYFRWRQRSLTPSIILSAVTVVQA